MFFSYDFNIKYQSNRYPLSFNRTWTPWTVRHDHCLHSCRSRNNVCISRCHSEDSSVIRWSQCKIVRGTVLHKFKKFRLEGWPSKFSCTEFQAFYQLNNWWLPSVSWTCHILKEAGTSSAWTVACSTSWNKSNEIASPKLCVLAAFRQPTGSILSSL